MVAFSYCTATSSKPISRTQSYMGVMKTFRVRALYEGVIHASLYQYKYRLDQSPKRSLS